MAVPIGLIIRGAKFVAKFFGKSKAVRRRFMKGKAKQLAKRQISSKYGKYKSAFGMNQKDGSTDNDTGVNDAAPRSQEQQEYIDNNSSVNDKDLEQLDKESGSSDKVESKEKVDKDNSEVKNYKKLSREVDRINEEAETLSNRSKEILANAGINEILTENKEKETLPNKIESKLDKDDFEIKLNELTDTVKNKLGPKDSEYKELPENIIDKLVGKNGLAERVENSSLTLLGASHELLLDLSDKLVETSTKLSNEVVDKNKELIAKYLQYNPDSKLTKIIELLSSNNELQAINNDLAKLNLSETKSSVDQQVMAAISTEAQGKESPSQTDISIPDYQDNKNQPKKEDQPLVEKVLGKAGSSLLKSSLAKAGLVGLAGLGASMAAAKGANAVSQATIEHTSSVTGLNDTSGSEASDKETNSKPNYPSSQSRPTSSLNASYPVQVGNASGSINQTSGVLTNESGSQGVPFQGGMPLYTFYTPNGQLVQGSPITIPYNTTMYPMNIGSNQMGSSALSGNIVPIQSSSLAPVGLSTQDNIAPSDSVNGSIEPAVISPTNIEQDQRIITPKYKEKTKEELKNEYGLDWKEGDPESQLEFLRKTDKVVTNLIKNKSYDQLVNLWNAFEGDLGVYNGSVVGKKISSALKNTNYRLVGNKYVENQSSNFSTDVNNESSATSDSAGSNSKVLDFSSENLPYTELPLTSDELRKYNDWNPADVEMDLSSRMKFGPDSVITKGTNGKWYVTSAKGYHLGDGYESRGGEVFRNELDELPESKSTFSIYGGDFHRNRNEFGMYGRSPIQWTYDSATGDFMALDSNGDPLGYGPNKTTSYLASNFKTRFVTYEDGVRKEWVKLSDGTWLSDYGDIKFRNNVRTSVDGSVKPWVGYYDQNGDKVVIDGGKIDDDNTIWYDNYGVDRDGSITFNRDDLSTRIEDGTTIVTRKLENGDIEESAFVLPEHEVTDSFTGESFDLDNFEGFEQKQNSELSESDEGQGYDQFHDFLVQNGVISEESHVARTEGQAMANSFRSYFGLDPKDYTDKNRAADAKRDRSAYLKSRDKFELLTDDNYAENLAAQATENILAMNSAVNAFRYSPAGSLMEKMGMFDGFKILDSEDADKIHDKVLNNIESGLDAAENVMYNYNVSKGNTTNVVNNHITQVVTPDNTELTQTLAN